MTGTARGIFRLVRILGHLLVGVWVTWRLQRQGAGPEAHSQVRRAWYRRALQLAGVYCEVAGEPPREASLVVANHVSWLDIPLLGAAVDPCFLSKAEIARWPIIGWLARRHGTRFIRRGGHEASAHVEAMREGLDAGRHFVVFPEGTTTRGHGLRRFHPRLFAAVTGTAHPVQPVALDYESYSDGTVPVAFAGHDRLVPNVWRLLCRPRTRVSVHVLEPLEGRDRPRRELAEAARLQIVEVLGVPAEPIDGSRPGRG